jgi:hypothetical protein
MCDVHVYAWVGGCGDGDGCWCMISLFSKYLISKSYGNIVYDKSP